MLGHWLVVNYLLKEEKGQGRRRNCSDAELHQSPGAAELHGNFLETELNQFNYQMIASTAKTCNPRLAFIIPAFSERR